MIISDVCFKSLSLTVDLLHGIMWTIAPQHIEENTQWIFFIIFTVYEVQHLTFSEPEVLFYKV